MLTFSSGQSLAATSATEMGVCPAGQNPYVVDPSTGSRGTPPLAPAGQTV